jgi:hypothetical protein
MLLVTAPDWSNRGKTRIRKREWAEAWEMATIADFIGALIVTGVLFAVFMWLLSKVGIARTFGAIAANILS